MIKQGTGGSIMFTASIAGQKTLLPMPTAAYNFSKAGLLQLKSNLAAEWAQYGIRVNSISPGYMDTAMTNGFSGLHKIWEAQTPMGRMGDRSELAGVIVLFCSPAGRYITGVDILVDGQSPRFPLDSDFMINEDIFQVELMYVRDPECFQFSEAANQFLRCIWYTLITCGT
jgi:NAD(P)-dependent dehydrogenase (short-subunit alcohol dehydrogenase family)